MKDYYKDFYKYYDTFMEQTDYKKWSEYIFKLSEESTFDKKNVLDLACGSGKMLLEFTNAYKGNFYGVDLSEGMLSLADQRLFRHKKRVKLIKGNISEFKINKEFDFVYCACDSINYIFDETNLLNTFKNVFDMLKQGRVFTFDILNDNFDLNEEKSFEIGSMIFNIKREKKGNIFHTKINVNGDYFEHMQRLYNVIEIEELLKKAGFSYIECYNFLTKDNANLNEEKIQFKVKK